MIVVPGEEGVSEGQAVLDTATAVRELRPVLDATEQALLIRIAAGVIRAARRFRQAGIGMDSELARSMPCLARGSVMNW